MSCSSFKFSASPFSHGSQMVCHLGMGPSSFEFYLRKTCKRNAGLNFTLVTKKYHIYIGIAFFPCRRCSQKVFHLRIAPSTLRCCPQAAHTRFALLECHLTPLYFTRRAHKMLHWNCTFLHKIKLGFSLIGSLFFLDGLYKYI